MPTRCVVFGCNNTNDKERGISLHEIPFYGDDRPVAKQLGRQWVNFVKQKRANFEPSKRSVVCSQHFSAEAFGRVAIPSFSAPKKFLKRDEIGVYVFPTIQSVSQAKPSSERDTRMVSF